MGRQRLGKMSVFLQQHADIIVGNGIIRRQTQRLTMGADRSVEMALLAECNAEIGPGVRAELRCRLAARLATTDGTAIGEFRVAVTIEIHQCVAKIKIRFGVIRLQPNRPGIGSGRLESISGAPQHDTKIEMRTRQGRVDPRRFPIGRDCPRDSPLILEHDADFAVDGDQLWIASERLLIDRKRSVELALRIKRVAQPIKRRSVVWPDDECAPK